jgi:CDP-paratose 2-epimerase
MKILVTGGAGFIGTNVCLEAVTRGHEVCAFDNFVRPLTEENLEVLKKAGVKIVRGDIRNWEDFQKFPWIPEGIVHLAGQCGIPYAQINPRYDFQVNALGTLNVLEYCRLNGKIPVAFASSNKAYTNITDDFAKKETETRYEWDFKSANPEFLKWGITEKGVNEKLPLDAFGQFSRSLYGVSKVSGDLYMQEYYQAFGIPTVINRMSCIYGLYQKGVEDQAWVDWFIRQIMLGDCKLNIFGTGKQVRDMLFGSDVARLYVMELENIDKVKGKQFNIGGGLANTMSLIEAINEIEKQTGNKAELTFLPKRHGDQDIWISDISKIKSLLGWEPTISPAEGIGIIINQYK